MIHEFTVIIGVNASGKQQRWIYRVSGSEQSVFLRKMQDEKKYIESARDLYAKVKVKKDIHIEMMNSFDKVDPVSSIDGF